MSSLPNSINSISSFTSFDQWVNNVPLYGFDIEAILPDVVRLNYYWQLYDKVLPIDLNGNEYPYIVNEPIIFYSRPILIPNFDVIRCMLFNNIQTGLKPNRLYLKNMVTEDLIYALNDDVFFTITRQDASNISKFLNLMPNGLFTEATNILLHFKKNYEFFLSGKRECNVSIPWYSTFSAEKINEIYMPLYLPEVSFESSIIAYRTAIIPLSNRNININPIKVNIFNEQINKILGQFLKTNQISIFINLYFGVLYDLLLLLKDPNTNSKPYMSKQFYAFVDEIYLQFYKNSTGN